MGRLRRALLAVVVLLLPACTATVREPPDPRPWRPGHVTPGGWHGIGFHGVSLDVPDTVTLSDGPGCGGLPATGDLVLAVFATGAFNCPAAVGTVDPPPPRPDTVLTVVLTETGTPAADAPAGSRSRVLATAGTTVTAAGPGDTVDAVLASVRVTSRDDHGCDQRIDPGAAPRPLDPDGTDLLPVPTRAVTVCEYGRTAPHDAPSSPLWLVGSREVGDDVAADVDRQLRAASRSAPSDLAVAAAFEGPVLRLLVRGDDGDTRVLQAVVDLFPQPVTDGHLTVEVGTTTGGAFSPLPTPFGGA